jgi:hypothetical protein
MKRMKADYGTKTALVVFISLIMACGVNAKEIIKQGEFYEIVVTRQIENRAENAIVKTSGKTGYHCNTMYPWKLTIDSQDETKVYKKEDAVEFSERSVVFKVQCKKNCKALLIFSVCNDKQCKMEKVEINL